MELSPEVLSTDFKILMAYQLCEYCQKMTFKNDLVLSNHEIWPKKNGIALFRPEKAVTWTSLRISLISLAIDYSEKLFGTTFVC